MDTRPTTLELITTSPPYKFKSLGKMSRYGFRWRDEPRYDQSELFPIGKEVELTEGKFPLTEYGNMHQYSRSAHIIDGKTVGIVGTDDFCGKGQLRGQLNEYARCRIHVVLDEDGIVRWDENAGHYYDTGYSFGDHGGRRSTRKRSTRRRSTRRRSTRRRY